MGRLSNRKGPVGRGSLLAVELAPRHSFYDRCNEILAEVEFDEAVEMLCQPYCEDDGRLSVPPGRYFRMRFVGQSWVRGDRAHAWIFARPVKGFRQTDSGRVSMKQAPPRA